MHPPPPPPPPSTGFAEFDFQRYQKGLIPVCYCCDGALGTNIRRHFKIFPYFFLDISPHFEDYLAIENIKNIAYLLSVNFVILKCRKGDLHMPKLVEFSNILLVHGQIKGQNPLVQPRFTCPKIDIFLFLGRKCILWVPIRST